MNDQTRQEQEQKSPWRIPIPAPVVCDKYNIDGALWLTLTEAIWPNAETSEAIILALSYCYARKLDPLKKPVHIVPMWNSELRKNVETVWPAISELRTTASRTGAHAGKSEPDFGPDMTETFSGQTQKGSISAIVTFPEWCKVTVYKMVHGTRCPFTATVFWKEAYATIGNTNVPNNMWQRRARGQLAKCAEAEALREAFPEELGSDYAAEEMAGRALNGTAEQVTSDDAPPRPKPEDFEQKATDLYTMLDEFGESMGELSEHELVEQAVAKIEGFTEREHLDAFMEFNEGFEHFEPRSEARQAIARAFNDAKQNIPSGGGQDSNGDTPPAGEPEQGWEDWSDALAAQIGLVENKAGLDKLWADNGAMLGALKEDAPALHTSILNAFNARLDKVTAPQTQE